MGNGKFLSGSWLSASPESVEREADEFNHSVRKGFEERDRLLEEGEWPMSVTEFKSAIGIDNRVAVYVVNDSIGSRILHLTADQQLLPGKTH